MALSAAQKRKAADDKARQGEDDEVLYHMWLDEQWPDWRKGGVLYLKLRHAFMAGMAAARMGEG